MMRPRRKLLRSDSSEKIETSLKNRRSSMSSSQFFTALGDWNNKLFDHIILFGVPLDHDPRKKPTPEILMIYPGTPLEHTEAELESYKRFAFPNGVLETPRVKKTAAHISEEFIFKTNHVGPPVYGICIEFLPIEGLDAFFLSNKNDKYIFVLCMTTRNPCYGAHFQFLTHLNLVMVKKDKTRININDYPMYKIETEGITAKNLKLENDCGVAPGIIVPPEVLNIMQIYRKLELTSTEQKIFFSSFGRVYLPPKNSSLFPPSFMAASVSLDALFSFLSIENVITLFTSVCMEYNTLVMSKSLHKITTTILAIRSLLYPLKASCVLNFILPNDAECLGMLESPVSFIVGVVTDPKLNSIKMSSPRIIVDLDNCLVRITKEPPKLPTYSRLRSKLEAILNDKSVNVPDRNADPSRWQKFILQASPFNHSIHYLSTLRRMYIFNDDTVRAIQREFMNALVGTFEELLPACFVTDSTNPEQPVSVFNKELFMSNFADSEFMEAFIDTQMFHNFCERHLENVERSKKSICTGKQDDDNASLLAQQSLD